MNIDYKELIKAMPIAFAHHQVVKDETGNITDFIYLDANPAFVAMTGMQAKDTIDKTVSQAVHNIRESSFDWITILTQVAATGQDITFEQYSEPLKRWYQVTVYSNEPDYFTTVFRDITDSKLREIELQNSQNKQIADLSMAKAELRKSEERYFSLISNLPVGIHRTTPGDQGRFILANPTSVAIFGYDSEEEIKQIYVSDVFVNPEDRKMFSESLTSRGIINQEMQLRKKDGTISWFYESARAVFDDDGNVKYFDCILQDITDRKLAEEALHYQFQYEMVKAERDKEKQYRQLVEMSPTEIGRASCGVRV